MSNIYQVALDYRRRLLAHDADAAITLVQAYRQAQKRLDDQIEALARQIAAQQAAGETVTRGRLLRMERYRALERQILDEVRRLTAMAEGVISGGQALAVDLGAEAALQTALSSAGVGVVWNRLPTGAFEQLVGALSDGSPLRDLLDELPEATARNVRDRLLQGLALGYNPRKIAALGRNELGLTEQRLLTISRTEIARAYRAATLETYRANSHLIEGWRWVAAKSFRTCPACLAMDGKVFELEIEPGMHPN
ncbi:MAG: phage head morphogenesis protein, partial [Chloroflexota bacterium]|nr:phage head morphogenesis protein [Chloroflexota bacterium]